MLFCPPLLELPVRGLSCGLLVGIVSCGAPSPDPGPAGARSDSGALPTGCFANEAMVDVGTGATAFEPLAEGDPVVMVHGPQGGWHLLGSVRTHNMTEVVRIRFEVVVEDTGAVVADNSLYVQTLPDGDCAGVYPGMYAYLVVEELADGDADTPPELLAYKSLMFRAFVEDQDGRTASGEVRITATPDPVDLEDDGDTAAPG